LGPTWLPVWARSAATKSGHDEETQQGRAEQNSRHYFSDDPRLAKPEKEAADQTRDPKNQGNVQQHERNHLVRVERIPSPLPLNG